ncbi:hypothetical protein CCR97_05630 [Rhodoplanes elegans]|uniref:Uncharacterized protein n=1 Tax=Rhodoplanes elegans TaxID=29408 RepID=A0A327KU51_9BRAD|nr:hypothetical protein [Rhodoplanes elegans]MBK5957690.1 hypothetical protein [Rhodoplanes elegans]RAI41556.1 hypothetical protein CH338_02760 [Rhodoplanes elegans]
MFDLFNRKRLVAIVAGLSAVVLSTGIAIDAAKAQGTPLTRVSAVGQVDGDVAAPRPPKPAAKSGGRYYVDFRARTAASYGHAFIWYGKSGQRAVEVAGLHPATDSVIPYILGHILPVPAETGKSYGDLDEQYLTASYRVYLTDAEAQKVFAYIKRKQATTLVWNAATINCVAFISDIAQYMGLEVPSSNLLYPEDWVNRLRALNRGRKVTVSADSAGFQSDAR